MNRRSIRALLGVAGVILSAAALMAQGTIPVVLFFGVPVADTDILALLEKHDAQPYAVYMTSGGMSGIHRVDPTQASFAVVEDARQATASAVVDSLPGTGTALRSFVREVSREQLLASAELQERGRSQLRHEEQNRAVLKAARSGAPMIYAVEVMVEASLVDALTAEPLVREAAAGVLHSGRAMVDRPSAPTMRSGLEDIEQISASVLYDRIRRAAARSEEVRRAL